MTNIDRRGGLALLAALVLGVSILLGASQSHAQGGQIPSLMDQLDQQRAAYAKCFQDYEAAETADDGEAMAEAKKCMAETLKKIDAILKKMNKATDQLTIDPRRS